MTMLIGMVSCLRNSQLSQLVLFPIQGNEGKFSSSTFDCVG
jgi:hypothetical protein